MKRNPLEQYTKDPDREARLFLFTTVAMVISTALLTIGTLIFILHLLGFF
ncbi:hypothetical protein LJB96_01945 [Methanobrevibacter sp. OttesenSCG-928-K11]|nr:hypothetical protein [Methanobrevibacter sp. OttesenSCG-928-K11]MDL2270662.1 hypothetical protein [Methanobrevibacter sp. OttesenSCG-928-I08]